MLDSVWGGLNLLGAASAASSSRDDDRYASPDHRKLVIGLGVMWAAISAASAMYGYSNVSECRTAKERQMLRQFPQQRPFGYPAPR